MPRCPKCSVEWEPSHLFCPRDGARLVHGPGEPNASTPADPVAAMPGPGAILDGKYELREIIGEGTTIVIPADSPLLRVLSDPERYLKDDDEGGSGE